MTSKVHPPYGYSGSGAKAPARTPRAERLLTIIEVARRLRLHPNSVRNLIRCGDLSSYQLLNRVRVPARDVIRYMQRHQASISRRPPTRRRRRTAPLGMRVKVRERSR